MMNNLIGQGMYGMAPLHRCHCINQACILWTKEPSGTLFQESKNFGTSRRLIVFLDAFTLPFSHGGLVLDFTSNPDMYLSIQLPINLTIY